MASQVKVRFSRPQAQRLSKGIPKSPVLSKDTPKTAGINSSVPNLRTSTGLRASLLPVPVSNVNNTEKTKGKINKHSNNSSPLASTVASGRAFDSDKDINEPTQQNGDTKTVDKPSAVSHDIAPRQPRQKLKRVLKKNMIKRQTSYKRALIL